MHDWAEASPAHCSSCLWFVGVSPPDGWALEERQDVRARGPGTHLRPGLLGLALANGAGARRAQWWPSLILSRTEGTGCCTAAFPHLAPGPIENESTSALSQNGHQGQGAYSHPQLPSHWIGCYTHSKLLLPAKCSLKLQIEEASQPCNSWPEVTVVFGNWKIAFGN